MTEEIYICPFHQPHQSAYCLIGDCIYSEDNKKCPIYERYFIITRGRRYK